MPNQFDGLEISTEKLKLQIEPIHRFLSQEAYWSLGVPLEVVKRAISGSLCFGVYDKHAHGQQVGFARVVSDQATFAWICDVYVEKEYRGRGVSKWLMENLMSHSELKGLRRICLATKDAHALYEKFGFIVTQTPDNWLEIKDNDIYKR
jgi:GNAT superfamily N-acetyltransferase